MFDLFCDSHTSANVICNVPVEMPTGLVIVLVQVPFANSTSWNPNIWDLRSVVEVAIFNTSLKTGLDILRGETHTHVCEDVLIGWKFGERQEI